jgi:hypothetical protein
MACLGHSFDDMRDEATGQLREWRSTGAEGAWDWTPHEVHPSIPSVVSVRQIEVGEMESYGQAKRMQDYDANSGWTSHFLRDCDWVLWHRQFLSRGWIGTRAGLWFWCVPRRSDCARCETYSCRVTHPTKRLGIPRGMGVPPVLRWYIPYEEAR